MNPPSSTEYRAPQLLGDEQSRLVRMEEMSKGIKDLMSDLRDDMKSINNKLSALEQNRAVSDLQASQNAKDIIALESDLKVACTKISDVQAELKGYKFTGNILRGIAAACFSIAFACIGWVFNSINAQNQKAGEINTQVSINSSKLTRIDTDMNALSQRTSDLERKGQVP